MLKKEKAGTPPPRAKYPVIAIYKDFLSEENHKKILGYFNNELSWWGASQDPSTKTDSPVRYKLTEHSKDKSLEYLRTVILDDEYFGKLNSSQLGEPFPEGLKNPVDWSMVLHTPEDSEILGIIKELDDAVQQQIFEIYGQRAECTFPPMFTMIDEDRSIRLHCDGYDFDGNRKYKESVCHFSSIYYINDNYIGGENYAPYLGYEYKPRANSLLLNCTPWDEDMAHGVLPVTSGKRFVRQHFWILKTDSEQ
jgi:hypothetical protein